MGCLILLSTVSGLCVSPPCPLSKLCAITTLLAAFGITMGRALAAFVEPGVPAKRFLMGILP